MNSNNWTKEETIIAFNVYCKIPFKNSSKNHPLIIKFANIIGRSPSALNMKIGNFGRLDPELQKQGIVGLRNGSKLEEEVWDEFHGDWEKLAYESEMLIAKYLNKPLEESIQLNEFELKNKIGLDREAIVKQRVNQSFFRSTILSSYNLKCCITGISIPDFLVAGHIKPWAEDKANRLNPHNGICLNNLHDKAFEKGFITITTDYKVKVSKVLNEFENENSIKDLIFKYDNKQIILPDRFLPSKEFLEYHYEEIFKK